MKPPFLPSKQYNSETLLYRDRILAAGGTLSVATLDAVEKFVRDCRASNLWDLLLDVGLLAGDQLAAALVKLKAAPGTPVQLTNHNFVSGDYTERGASGGLLGDGVCKYLETGFNPYAQGLTPSDHHLSVYSTTNSFAAAYRDALGAFETVNRFCALRLSGADGQRNYFYPDTQTSGLATNQAQDTSGYLLGSAGIFYRNGAAVGTTGGAPAGTLPNVAVHLFAVSTNGVAGAFNDKRLAFYTLGRALSATQAAQLNIIVQTLQANLNRRV